MLYTLWLTMIAHRPIPDRREVWASIIPLTLAGQWAIGIVADLVATFAALQFYGLHLQQAGTVPHETR